MTDTKTLILNSKIVDQKINRITYQILEEFHLEKKIIFAGISKKGFLFAKKIHSKFLEYSDIDVELTEILIKKDKPLLRQISISPNVKMSNKTIILIDDVLNSGNTLMYAAGYLIDKGIRQMKTVVLIDRRHRKFPIRADWVGLTLSTTLQEHISVEFNKNKIEVFLQ